MKAPNLRIARWLKFGMLFLLLAVLGLAVYVVKVYYDLRSTTIEQVVQRQQQAGQDAADADEAKLPSLLEDPLDKANQLSNKPISKQDMMDAAAILLNSGLSMKEMYYLMGQSTEQLTDEEKQNIRDLLLEKLNQEQISALRNITKKYGKGLNILDPKFPIELVGVYDEAERKRIMKKLKEREKTLTTTVQPEAVLPNAALTEQIKSPAVISDEKALKKVEAKYIPRLERLKQSCQSQVQKITNDITGVMADRNTLDEKMMSELKTKYLKRAADAEAGCSRQLQTIIDQAKAEYRQAGLEESIPESWRQDYEKVKREAQAKALSQLENQTPK